MATKKTRHFATLAPDRCGYCFWSFANPTPGCAQCSYGAYAKARAAYRQALRATGPEGKAEDG